MIELKRFLDRLVIISLIFGFVFIVTSVLIRFCGIQFRAWVNVLCLSVMLFGLSIGILYKALSTNNIKKKALCLGVIVVAIVVLWLFRLPLLVLSAFLPYKDRVDTIDNITFVGYEDNFLDHWINYYEYKNVFVSGTKNVFTLDKVEETEDGNTIYYDLNGTQIHHLDELYGYGDTIAQKDERGDSEKEHIDLNSESTEETKFKSIDWQYYEDHMQQEDVVDFKEYYNVLANEEKFIFLDTNKEITFDDFLLGIESDSEPDIEGIVILDLDNQNGKELIINIYEAGGLYLILSRDSGQIYGKMMSAREFEELQNDGKYIGAGGAGDLYFRRMKIDGDGAEETLIGELHGKENEDGSVTDELEVDGVVVDDAQEWVDENYSDPVSWIE